MRIPVASDWHLSERNLVGIPTVVNILKEAIDVAAKTDKLLIAPGDLTNEPVVGGETLDAVAEVCDYSRERGVELVVIPGNHSKSALGRWVESHLGIHKLAHITVSTQPEILDVSDTLSIVSAPFGTKWGQVQQLIEGLGDVRCWSKRLDGQRKYLFVAHDEVQGADFGNGHKASDGYSLEDLKASPFSFFAFGHIHRQQELDAGPARPCFYSGALAQYGYGASNQSRGYSVLDTDTQAVRFVSCVGGRHPLFHRASFREWVTQKLTYEHDERVWLELTAEPDDPPDSEIRKLVTFKSLQKLELKRTSPEHHTVQRTEVKMSDDLRTMLKKIADAKLSDERIKNRRVELFDRHMREIGR